MHIRHKLDPDGSANHPLGVTIVHCRRGQYGRRTGERSQADNRTHRDHRLAEKLTPEGKRQLIERLARDLQRIPQSPLPLPWKETCRLGKDIWEGVDVDRYIDALRNAWER
jgi:hypothetical protein